MSHTSHTDRVSQRGSKRFELGELEQKVLGAATGVPLSKDNPEVTLSTLCKSECFEKYKEKYELLPEQKWNRFIFLRNQVLHAIVAGAHPMIDGAKYLKEWKSDFAGEVKFHPLNPGVTEREKADIARGFVDRVATAAIKSLPPELQADLSR